MAMLAPACTGSSAENPRIEIDHATALVSSPIHIVVNGLHVGEAATLSLSTTAVGAHLWSSSASFVADSNGRIDMSKATPLRGSYRIADGMGLFWSMTPSGPAPEPSIIETGSPVEVDRLVLSIAGREREAKVLVRELAGPGVSLTFKRTPADPFYGDYFSPADLSTRRPAVLVFGGSEGGLSGIASASQLASNGFPALAIAYFAEPGLPPTLREVPLEYFVGALRWLSQQPGVDPAHLVVEGVSRGGEAALLLGSDFPDLVHGVIALVPSAWVNCSLPVCDHSAWTLRGSPLPFTGKVPDAKALIPIARIRGPVFVDCGGVDAVWPSCQYVDEIKRELASGFSFPLKALEFPDAGHGIGTLLPFVSTVEPVTHVGKTAEANPRAREEAWPQLVSFLASQAA